MVYMQIACKSHAKTKAQTFKQAMLIQKMYLEYEVHSTSTKGPQQYRAVVSLQVIHQDLNLIKKKDKQEHKIQCHKLKID